MEENVQLDALKTFPELEMGLPRLVVEILTSVVTILVG